MGAVSSAIDDAVGFVGDVVGGAAKAIDNTVTNAIKNPELTLMQIGAVASGNPELLPYINAGYSVSKGADPTKIAENAALGAAIGQVVPTVSGDVTDMTGSAMAGNAAQSALRGGIQAGLTGKDVLAGAENSAINSAGNAELKDVTGGNLPVSVNFAGALNSPSTSAPREATHLAGAPSSTSNQSALNIGQLGMPNLDMGKLALPTIGLTSTAPSVLHSKEGGGVDHPDFIPELIEILKERHAQHFGTGGSSLNTDSSTADYNNSVMMQGLNNPDEFDLGTFKSPESFQKSLAPKFAKTYDPSSLQVKAPAQPYQKQIVPQLSEGPLSNVHRFDVHQNSGLGTHLAKGGLPHEYKEAAPEGHKPEFITGLTGYYAHGKGTGQSDDIPAMLHDGDYVADADLVAALGDGSSKAGAEALEHFRRSIPHHESVGGQPVAAQIADGEYVLPANFVTSIGHGDNKAGAKLLDKMRETVRAHKRSAPDSKIPPKAKSPLEYLKMAAKG